jgi:hypothetical protein
MTRTGPEADWGRARRAMTMKAQAAGRLEQILIYTHIEA